MADRLRRSGAAAPWARVDHELTDQAAARQGGLYAIGRLASLDTASPAGEDVFDLWSHRPRREDGECPRDVGPSGRLCRPHPAGRKARRLPVQAPVRFELVVNLKAAKAIGLTIPEAFLLRADELIQ